MIAGEKVFLTGLERANAETARAWLNDPAVNRFMEVGQVPITAAAEAAFYDRLETSSSDFVFEIHLEENGRYVGNIGLHGVDWRHRFAELGLFLGSPVDHGRGYAADAIRTILRFAFDTLGLHRVRLRCYEGNEAGLRLYRHLGFTEVGRHRETFFRDGRFWDEFHFDMLDHEFRAGDGAVAGAGTGGPTA
mgnify:FL=1